MNPQMNQSSNQVNPQMNQQPMYRKPSRAPWLVLAIVALIVLGVLGYMFRDKLSGTATKANKLSGYQAVFLTNGQVYFGKLANAESDYLTLKDIYYLQVNQPLQSGQQTATEQPQLSLVKLGNELHGPVDSMQINRQQVLFFEDLKSDGKVAQAIEQYKKNGTTAPASTAPANTIPATGTPTK